jgi:ribosome assembly protein YihI (activator of Der GTPase)
VGVLEKKTCQEINKKGRLTSRTKKKKNQHSFSKKEVNLPYGKLGNNYKFA